MKLKSGTKKQRQEAHKFLYEASHSHHGAVEIARYFIETLPYSRIVDAYETLKDWV